MTKIKSHYRGAFTVVELIVYLGVVSGILLANLMLISVVRSNQIGDSLFWKTFRDSWQRTSSQARRLHHQAIILISSQDVELYQPGSSERPTIIYVPHDLTLKQARSIWISQDGFAKPTTIRWYGRDNCLKYKQTVQLGWSGFNVKNYR